MSKTLITGIGVAAPTGLGIERYWSATLDRRHGIDEVIGFDASKYPARLAGQVRDFDPAEHIPNRLLPQTDRVTRLSLAVADWAMADAAVPVADLPYYDMGVIVSNGQGGSEFTHREFRKLWSKGPEFVSVYESFAWFYAANAGQISIRHGLRGPSGVLVGEQAGGLDALGHARRTLRQGAKLMLAGGADSAFDPWGFLSQYAHGRVSRQDDPEHAYLPFDRRANGYVPAEGAAILVLEDGESAEARNANCYGELVGYASTFDPAPDSGRPSTLGRAIELALADAGIDAADVGVVYADSAGLVELDTIEAQAIVDVFGPRGVPVTAPKSAYGRLGAGGGPLDVASALLGMRDSVIPPTVHTADVPDEYGIDLVTGAPRPVEHDTALVLARGYGGFNSAIVLRGTTN
jgi:act minimal PKS chain-length factor (CLF/KS beta)